MRNLFLIAFAFFLASSILADSILADKIVLKNLEAIQKGDYWIYSQEKNLVVLKALESKDSILSMEEVVLPKSLLGKEGLTHWVKENFPRSTSRLTFKIDLSNGTLSFHESDHELGLLSKLCELEFEKIPEKLRKRLGKDGEGKIWNPRIFFEGKQSKNVVSIPWKGIFPKGKDAFSGKSMIVYFPETQGKEDEFVKGLPYWIELRHGWRTDYAYVVESGKKLIP